MKLVIFRSMLCCAMLIVIVSPLGAYDVDWGTLRSVRTYECGKMSLNCSQNGQFIWAYVNLEDQRLESYHNSPGSSGIYEIADLEFSDLVYAYSSVSFMGGVLPTVIYYNHDNNDIMMNTFIGSWGNSVDIGIPIADARKVRF